MTGNQWKVWRQKQGWTQTELGKRLGVSRKATVSVWESSRKIPEKVAEQVQRLQRRVP